MIDEVSHKCLTCPLLLESLKKTTEDEDEKTAMVEHFPTSWSMFTYKRIKELLSKPLRT